ncbi:MAG: tetratricopeptide repeat protein [Thermoanaerobaculales bacterium]|nr:tetratricopeptide repeat protein [Thermoanaerobaculales bacterium]
MKSLSYHLMFTLSIGLALALTLGACASSSQKKTERQDDEDLWKQNPIYSLTLMRQGSQLLQQGRYEAALDKFEKANDLAPGNTTIFNMIGLCHLRLGQFDQALLAFGTSLDLAPAFTDARNNRGATYLAMGQYRMAEVDFSAVLSDSTYPHRSEVFYNLGVTYLGRGLQTAAKENFRRAVTSGRPQAEAFLRLAEIEQREGAINEALHLLEEACLKFPTRTEAQLALGKLLTQLDRDDEAEQHLRDVIRANPSSASADEARRLLGDI